ncbi:MAG: zinc-binding dehydrogenase, partial [Alphaproteobacteria bacterium]|nr:zinc-binding dehydrogenase [Alphaproteobacteria bacterium]
GHLLCQWAVQLGALVIATVGSDEKASLLADYGCYAVVNYNREDFAERVVQLTNGRGADVVYDAVGAATFDGSLRSLAVRGHIAVYGQSSGPIPPFEISRLAPKSASVTRVGYSHYLPDAAARRGMARRLFELVKSGALVPRPPRVLPLADAAEAHLLLESRALGPIVLVPEGGRRDA